MCIRDRVSPPRSEAICVLLVEPDGSFEIFPEQIITLNDGWVSFHEGQKTWDVTRLDMAPEAPPFLNPDQDKKPVSYTHLISVSPIKTLGSSKN